MTYVLVVLLAGYMHTHAAGFSQEFNSLQACNDAEKWLIKNVSPEPIQTGCLPKGVAQ